MIYISPIMYDSVNCAWVFYYQTLNWRNLSFYNPDGNNGDAVTYKVYMEAGTYTLQIVSLLGPAYGILKVSIDGVVVTTWDLYNVAYVRHRIHKESPIVVAESGLKNIVVYVDGKNASSSGYTFTFLEFAFNRTPELPAAPDIITDGLVAWWRQIEGGGNVVADSAGEHDGVPRGGGFWDRCTSDYYPVGAYDGATNDINGIGQGISRVGGESITVQTWFKLGDTPGAGGEGIITKKDGAGANWMCHVENYGGGIRTRFAFSTGGGAVWPVCRTWLVNWTIYENQWWMNTVKHTFGDGAQVEILYNDATAALDKGIWAAGTGDEAPDSTTGYIHIGSQDNVGDDIDLTQPIMGQIGDVLIYNRLLSDEEVSQNWNAMKSRYGYA